VPNHDRRGVEKVLPRLERIGSIGVSARTDDGIAYLAIDTFARDQINDFERALETLRSLRGAKALVLDVRNNSGGDEWLARRLAGFFLRDEKVYAAQRVRDPRQPDGFREREDRRLRGNADPDVFAGPVAVLMGPENMATSEVFLLMMKQAPAAVLVGANSYGSSGNAVAWQLLPGLVVMMPSAQALRPDGTMFEGEGITPHIHVPSTADQLAEADPVLEEALLRLRGQR
jgi:C-terminal processing protease CtpA/Prc